MNTTQDRFNALFDCVVWEISSAGGDGCGTIVFKQTSVRDAAKAFEEWKNARSLGRGFLPYRIDHKSDHVLFTDKSNENMTLVSKAETDTWPAEQRRLKYGDEIWLEVW